MPTLKYRILFVDDEASIRAGIHSVLKSAGYDLQTAPDGLVALKCLEGPLPELVIGDLRMPRISGFELHQDVLCSHELKGAKSRSVEASKELRDILEKIPSHDYLTDLESVKAILAEPEPSKRSSPKKAAKSAKVRKGSVAARKKSERKSSK